MNSGKRIYGKYLCVIFTTFCKLQVISSKKFEIKTFMELSSRISWGKMTISVRNNFRDLPGKPLQFRVGEIEAESGVGSCLSIYKRQSTHKCRTKPTNAQCNILPPGDPFALTYFFLTSLYLL